MALLATVERNRRELRDMQSPLVRELAELYAETLEVLDQDIRVLAEASRDRIAAGEAVPRSWIVQQETYQRISDQIEREITQINRYARDTIGSQTAQATRLGEQHAQQLMLEGMGPRPATVNITFANLPVGAINEIMAQTGPGTPLYQLFEKLSSNGPDWARQALIEGVMRGRPPRRIGRDLQQELGRSLARSITIARTEVLRSYRESTRQTYAANPRVVKAYRWTAALDDRTCPACIVMHGTIHQVSEVFGTHPRCRCSLTPITASWGELGFEGIPDRRPSFQSGIEWFEQLPAARQRDILGPSKYEAWSAGEFELPELVKYHDHPTWGPTRSEASLKSILGPKQAEEYYPAAAG